MESSGGGKGLDAPIVLVWISNLGWKTCIEGWALVNVSHPSLSNTKSSDNEFSETMGAFIIST